MSLVSKLTTKKISSPVGSPHSHVTRTMSNGSKQLLDSPSSGSLPKGMRYGYDSEFSTKVDELESSLSTVSNQQDALLPLMNLLDLAPNVQKTVGLMKNLDKRQDETEKKLGKLEDILKNNQEHTDLEIQKANDQQPIDIPDSSSFEKSLKSVFNRVAEQQYQYKDLENKLTNLDQGVIKRLKDELGSLSKTVESKLDKHRQETISALGELKNGTNNNLKRFDDVLKDIMGKSEKFTDFMQYNDRQKILEDINSLITMKNQEQLEFFRDKYDTDIENLYREFGIMRSEMDLRYDERKQQKIYPHLQALPKDVLPTEQKIKMHNLEQSLNIQELDKFNMDNTQRIMYEFQAFDDKLDQMRDDMSEMKTQIKASLSKKKSSKKASKEKDAQEKEKETELEKIQNKVQEDMELVNERYLNMKYQIEGAKKKYLFDMRKIEEKMDKLDVIKKETQDEVEKNPKIKKRIIPQELKTIDEFPDKIKKLMSSINKNFDTTFTRLDIIEEKIKDNVDYMNK